MPNVLIAKLDGFQSLEAALRGDILIQYGRRVRQPQGTYQFEAHRQEPNCTDVIGIHLNVIDNKVDLAISLGPNVQALTRGFAGLLASELSGSSPEEALALKFEDFEKITGVLSPKRKASLDYLITQIKTGIQQIAAASQTSVMVCLRNQANPKEYWNTPWWKWDDFLHADRFPSIEAANEYLQKRPAIPGAIPEAFQVRKLTSPPS